MSAAVATDPVSICTAVVAIVDPQLRRGVTDALAKTSAELLDDIWSSGDVDELIGAIERVRPAVLFLGLPGLKGDAAQALARLASLPSAPRIIAVSDNTNPDVILRTMRAGAVEFVYPPFEGFETSLRSVMTTPRAQADTPATGRVIAFSSAKGGCGATTLACHTASWLKNSGKKEVLMADMDVATGIAGTLMQADGRYTLDDALQNLHRLDLRLWRALVTGSQSGVDVIPAPAEPAGVIPITRKLPPLVRFWRTQYEFTIIDLGSGVTPMLLDVLNSVDTLVLVTTNEIPALRQARQMMQNLAGRGFGPNRVKLVINRMPKRPPIALPELERIMGCSIYSVVPNDYPALNEAYSHPRLVDLNSSIGTHFGLFAAKVAGVAPVEKKSRRLFAFR